MTEAAVVTEEDSKATYDDWDAADSLIGVTVLEEGGVRITGTGGTLIENVNFGSGIATDLDRTSPTNMVRAYWADHFADFEIESITCYLDPANGGAKEVEEWGIIVWALEAVEQKSVLELSLATIGEMWVTAGVAAGDVLFDFSALGSKPRPNLVQPRQVNTETYPHATSFIQVVAVKEDGYASNVAWMGGGGTVNVGATEIDGVVVTQSPHADFGAVYISSSTNTPRIKFTTQSFAAKTVSFYTGTPLDLGAVTGTLEFGVEVQTPRGTSVTAQVRDDADAGWVTFVDGNTLDDLAGVGLPGVRGRNDYEVQAILNTDGDATPVARVLSIREVSLTDLSDVTQVVAGRWAVDPQTLKAELPRFLIRGLHTGERDFYDAWTQLLAENDIGDIVLRLWRGHEDLARAKWMRLDDVIVEDVKSVGPSMEISGFSPLALVKKALPIYDSVNDTLDPIEYTNATLKAASEDLRDSKLGLARRYVGPGIEDTTQVSKFIEDSELKVELDALANLAGGTWSSSQGRVKYFDLHGQKSAVAYFTSEDIEPLEVTAGFEARQPEFFVDYAWVRSKRYWNGLVYRQHADSLAALGTVAIDAPTRVDPEIGRYITTLALAQTVGQRQVDSFGAGFIRLRFRSNYAYPELEIGDMVIVETEKFAIKDPTAASRAIRGWHWVRGVVISTDVHGREFAIWVRRFSDIISSTASGASSVGNFQRIWTSALVADGSGNFGPLRHAETGLAQDGDAVAFSRAYEAPPIVLFTPQVARTYVAADTASDQYLDIRALDLTVSGFNLKAKVLTGPATTAISDGFSAARNTAAPENTDVAVTADGAEVFSNLEDANTAETTYEAYFDIDASGMGSENLVTVLLYYSDRAADPGTVWTLGQSRTYDKDSVLTNEMLSFDAALDADWDVKLVLDYAVSPGSETATLTAHGENHGTFPGVQYEKVTAGAESAMTPNGGDRIRWTAIEAP